jgi:peptidoglycan/xylan/chitin deacetylase (PgdA/CDA1 family)
VPATLPGALVLSLDFELHWGVRDTRPARSAYTANLLGARAVIPRLLELFAEFEVAATWATVGFLFAGSRAEIQRFSPSVRPNYRDARLCPYAEPIGDCEESDPLHYAASLVGRIAGTPRQEVATHTFSHYYCHDDGCDRSAFRADLRAAVAIAADRGIRLSSIVFPRNQHEPQFDDLLLEHGITAYRGNPRSWKWDFVGSADGARLPLRAARLLDHYSGRGGDLTIGWAEVLQPSGLSDVRAGLPLRPFSPWLRHLEGLRLRRIRRALHAAGTEGRLLHLWWHPHNFGMHTAQNLAFLRSVLLEFSRCRQRYGMQSLSMAAVDRLARGGAPLAEVGQRSPGC